MNTTEILNRIRALFVFITLIPVILCAEATNAPSTNQAPPASASGTNLLEQLAGMEFDNAKDILDTIDPQQAVEWSLQLASSWYQRRAPDQMRSYIGYASALAERNDLKKQQAEIWFFRATVSSASHDLVGSLSLVEKTLEMAAQSDHTNLIRAALTFKGSILENQGRYGEAIEVHSELERMADTCDDGILRVDCIYNIAMLQSKMGNANLSEASLRKAIQICDEKQYPNGKANCLKLLGIYASGQKKKAEALDYYSKAAGIYKQTGDWIGYGNCFYNAGVLYRENNENEQALGCFLESLPSFTSAAALTGVGIAHMELGRTYFAMKKYSEAEQSYSLAEIFLTGSQSQANLAGLHSCIGDLKFEQGKTNEAGAHYEQSIAMYEELNLHQQASGQRMNLLKVRPIKPEEPAR